MTATDLDTNLIWQRKQMSIAGHQDLVCMALNIIRKTKSEVRHKRGQKIIIIQECEKDTPAFARSQR